VKSSRRAGVEPAQFLSGWKDIAGYLDKGVRTVQRYECEFGLPVRRPAGKPRGSVVATRDELDAWISASPIREVFELPPRPHDLIPASVEQIKKGVKEMAQLREQMLALRKELRASVQLVTHSVIDLEKQIRRNRTGLGPMTMTVLEEASRNEGIMELLSLRHSRKIS